MNNKIDWKYLRTQLTNSLSNEKIWSLACAISSEPNVHAENCQKLEQAIADIDSGSYEDFMQNFPEYLELDPATAVSHS